MVLAGKIFRVVEHADFNLIANKLRGYKTEQVVEDVSSDGKELKLERKIENLRYVGEALHGDFIYDELLQINYHGDYRQIPFTAQAHFFFVEENGQIFLTILERKQKANQIANEMSGIIFISLGKIVEVETSPDVFQQFHEQNFENTKVIFFDRVDLPNINKLSLYGASLGNTALYLDYLKHGKIWYIVLKSKKYGVIVGVTRNGVVVLFSKADKEDFISYIKEEIIPLLAEE
jgi:hypothetical protein